MERMDNYEPYFDSNLNDMSEWFEEQKSKYIFNTDKYKELKNRYKNISGRYPNVLKVYEDLEAIPLSIDEIHALIELRNIDIETNYMFNKLFFKLGIKEGLKFNEN